MECWKKVKRKGKLEPGKPGIMEEWNVGKMGKITENWKVGIME